jgi:hypothetical protein
MATGPQLPGVALWDIVRIYGVMKMQGLTILLVCHHGLPDECPGLHIR